MLGLRICTEEYKLKCYAYDVIQGIKEPRHAIRRLMQTTENSMDIKSMFKKEKLLQVI